MLSEQCKRWVYTKKSWLYLMNFGQSTQFKFLKLCYSHQCHFHLKSYSKAARWQKSTSALVMSM